MITASTFDLIWIEKEALPWWPAWLERWLFRNVPYVLDFDDAIFHNYDLHRFSIVRYILGRRIDYLMAGARLVIAGNRYLATRALNAGQSNVRILPTVVDAARYTAKPSHLNKTVPRIVWIGSPSTAQYLLDVLEPLNLLSKRLPFTLRVIGGGDIKLPGIDVEPIPWAETTEAELIAECDVGIMPLRDSPWEQGKCAYKLIQYMACALPTVCSPIGANMDVVVDNETGFFADSSLAWIEKLEKLLLDDEMRMRMGQCGRDRVEAMYSLQSATPRLIQLLKETT